MRSVGFSCSRKAKRASRPPSAVLARFRSSGSDTSPRPVGVYSSFALSVASAEQSFGLRCLSVEAVVSAERGGASCGAFDAAVGVDADPNGSFIPRTANGGASVRSFLGESVAHSAGGREGRGFAGAGHVGTV